MRIGRRDFLQLAAAAVAAGHLAPDALAALRGILGRAAPRVLWLQGAGCDGCAVSLLNSVREVRVAELLQETLDVRFQNNLMAAAGELAIDAAESARATPGYILVIEGAIPVGAAGRYCRLWGGLTMQAGLQTYAANAAYIVALGTCAAYGGVSAGAPNPTGAQGVGAILGSDPRLVNVPGCPAHPDWLVGTLSYLIVHNQVPPLDAERRPLAYYGRRVHDLCYKRHTLCGALTVAEELGQEGCLEPRGCKGKVTYADCPMRQWNSSGPGKSGVNWCAGARSPCLGCVQRTFPDGMSPFYAPAPAK